MNRNEEVDRRGRTRVSWKPAVTRYYIQRFLHRFQLTIITGMEVYICDDNSNHLFSET